LLLKYSWNVREAVTPFSRNNHETIILHDKDI